MNKIQLAVTSEQAQVIASALDLYSRLSMGQVCVFAEMISMEEIPVYSSHSAPSKRISADQCDLVREKIKEVSGILGYSGFGHSLGVGNKNVPIAGHRAYEISKVLEKVLAEQRDPNPRSRGVNYDGLRIRYTQDPAPECAVIENESPNEKA